MASTWYGVMPTVRATAAKGICGASTSTSASNNSVKPESLPANGGLTNCTEPSGNFTRGVRTSSTHSCWKKLRCR